jgi:hypothetical protein
VEIQKSVILEEQLLSFELNYERREDGFQKNGTPKKSLNGPVSICIKLNNFG